VVVLIPLAATSVHRPLLRCRRTVSTFRADYQLSSREVLPMIRSH